MKHQRSKKQESFGKIDKFFRFWKSQSTLVRFYSIFLYLTLLFYLALHQQTGQRLFNEFLPVWMAQGIAWFLNLLGQEAIATGKFVHVQNGLSLEIIYHCLGISLVGVFVAAVLAYPATWKQKGLGLLGGIPLLFLLNMIRIVGLALVGKHWPASFELLHHYLWPEVLIVFVLALWSLWRTYIVQNPDPLTMAS